MDESQVNRIAVSIRAYLARRPQARDTVQGVHCWWIEWDVPPPPVAFTEAALEQLEREGAIERITVGNSVIWRRP